MAKRFTDTEKWSDPWFRKLPPTAKLIWIFLCDNCDHAGLWKVDRELAEFKIGCPIEWESVMTLLGERIDTHNPDYWFIQKFMSFQYGLTLGRFHKGDAVQSAISRVIDLGFKDSLERVIGGSIHPRMRVKAKAKAKAIPAVKDVRDGLEGMKSKDMGPAPKFIKPTVDQIAAFAKGYGKPFDARYFFDYYESNGWKINRNPMKNWQATVRNWIRRDEKNGDHHATKNNTRGNALGAAPIAGKYAHLSQG